MREQENSVHPRASLAPWLTGWQARQDPAGVNNNVPLPQFYYGATPHFQIEIGINFQIIIIKGNFMPLYVGLLHINVKNY